jgi:hypothetical protein
MAEYYGNQRPSLAWAQDPYQMPAPLFTRTMLPEELDRLSKSMRRAMRDRMMTEDAIATWLNQYGK